MSFSRTSSKTRVAVNQICFAVDRELKTNTTFRHRAYYCTITHMKVLESDITYNGLTFLKLINTKVAAIKAVFY